MNKGIRAALAIGAMLGIGGGVEPPASRNYKPEREPETSDETRNEIIAEARSRQKAKAARREARWNSDRQRAK